MMTLSAVATAHSPFEILDDLRRRERQAEIHAGGDDQRLANGERRGLHGVHGGHDLLHADGIADGRLLDDRHELIGDGREDVLDGLRQHDGLQRLAARQAEAAGGLRLAGVDALDTGADDLAEVGSGVQRQRNDARQKALKANEAEQLERRQRYAAENDIIDDEQLHQHRCRAEHLHIDGSENAQRLDAAHTHQRQNESQQKAKHDRQERQRDGADHALLEHGQVSQGGAEAIDRKQRGSLLYNFDKRADFSRLSAGEVCDFLTLSDACLPLIIQQTFVGVALGKRVGLGDELVHGAVLLGGCNGEVHGSQQRAVALAHADNGTLLLIGDVELDTQLRIVLGIGLGNDRFDERAVQLAAQQLGNDVRDLRELHDIGVRRVLLGEVGLNGAELRADLVLRLVGVGQRGEGIRLVLHGHERLAADIVDIREVHLVLTGGIGRVTGERKVDLLRAELAERAVEVHGDDLELEAEINGDVLRKRDVEAGQRRILVLIDGIEFIRREVRTGRDGQLAVRDSLQQRLQLLDGHGCIIGFICVCALAAARKQRQRQRKGQRQDDPFFHAFILLHVPAERVRFIV